MRTVRNDAGDAGVIGRDLGDVDAGSNIDPAFAASPMQSVGQRAKRPRCQTPNSCST